MRHTHSRDMRSHADAYEESCTHHPISHGDLPKSQAEVSSSPQREELLLAASPLESYNILFVNIKLPYVKLGTPAPFLVEVCGPSSLTDVGGLPQDHCICLNEQVMSE
jgi:hypothetical protein